MERSNSCSSGEDNCPLGIDAINNNNNKIKNNNNQSGYAVRQGRTRTLTPLQQHQMQQQTNNNNNLPSPTQRLHHRRKRLQRQISTELSDDADFAYAADLEEEDEDYEPADDEVIHEAPYKLLSLSPPLEHSSSAFDGQPSSLPNCFTSSYRHHHLLKHEESFDSTSTAKTSTSTSANTSSSSSTAGHSHHSHYHHHHHLPLLSPLSPTTRRHNFASLKRDNSTQSESSSRYSSVDSLLESRKPDPEAILINLGFGPVGSEDILSRIPKRFLKPSQVRGIDTEAFIRRLQLADNLADHSVLGYRGLTGNPDVPPSRIVAKIMQRFEVNERKKSMGSMEHTI